MFIIGKTYVMRRSAFGMELINSAAFCIQNDPGTRRRLKLIDDAKESDLENLDYEANFEILNLPHRDHMKEIKKTKENLHYNIIKRKYFKVKYPNFLTWHDKEQIRLLHQNNPQEWDIHKLSEGFPAPPDVIEKILKSNWKMENYRRLEKHDTLVQENWRKFKNGELKNLPEHLLKHLEKFSNREFNFHSYKTSEPSGSVQITKTSKCTEFSDIITSFKKLKSKDDSKNIGVKIPLKQVQQKEKLENDTYISGDIKNKELVTLDILKDNQKHSYQDSKIMPFNGLKNDEKNLIKPTFSNSEIDVSKYNTGRVMEIDEKKEKDYNHLCYPQKITIPKQIYKRGYTYKLNDCYYDSDGLFLYRTPGLY